MSRRKEKAPAVGPLDTIEQTLMFLGIEVRIHGGRGTIDRVEGRARELGGTHVPYASLERSSRRSDGPRNRRSPQRFDPLIGRVLHVDTWPSPSAGVLDVEGSLAPLWR